MKFPPLFEAIKERNLQKVKEILDQSDSKASLINWQSPEHDGLTALILASTYGYTEIAEVLCDVPGVYPDFVSCKKRTALYEASRGGFHKIVERLLEINADPTIVSEDGTNVLHVSAKEGHSMCLSVLLDYMYIQGLIGSEIDLVSPEGLTPLGFAVRYRRMECVKIILQYKPNPNLSSETQPPPLLDVLSSFNNGNLDFQSIEIFRMLSKSPTLDPNIQKDQNKQTPLMMAIQLNLDDVVENLLIIGADPNAICISDYHKTPLAYTLTNFTLQKARMTEILLKYGANPRQQYLNGTTALRAASYLGNLSVVKLLLEAGADAKLIGPDGSNALHGATRPGIEEKNSYEIVELLLQYGANIHVSYTIGKETPLHNAALAGYSTVVRRLVESGIDVNVRASEGHTPLICAAAMGHVDCIRALLELGANRTLRTDADGMSALHIAARNGFTECVEVLVQDDLSLLEMHANDWAGSTPLFFAASNRFIEVVERLIDFGADEEQALLYACKIGDYNAVYTLLYCRTKKIEQAKNDKLASNDNSNTSFQPNRVSLKKNLNAPKISSSNAIKIDGTPLTVAAEAGHLNVVYLLINNGAHIDEGNFSGESPIVLAATAGHYEVTKILIDYGASDLLTAQTRAKRAGNDNIVELIEQGLQKRENCRVNCIIM